MGCCRGFAERTVAQDSAVSNDFLHKADGSSGQAPASKRDPASVKAAAHKPGASAAHIRSGMIKAVFLSPNVLMEPYRCVFFLVPHCFLSQTELHQAPGLSWVSTVLIWCVCRARITLLTECAVATTEKAVTDLALRFDIFKCYAWLSNAAHLKGWCAGKPKTGHTEL